MIRINVKIYYSHITNSIFLKSKNYMYIDHMRNTYDTHMTSNALFS